MRGEPGTATGSHSVWVTGDPNTSSFSEERENRQRAIRSNKYRLFISGFDPNSVKLWRKHDYGPIY